MPHRQRVYTLIKLYFDALNKRGIEHAYITLHVGAGTFQPIRSDNITAHNMHSEYIHIPETTCQKITQTQKKGGRIIAVGTTCVRALETAAIQQNTSLGATQTHPRRVDPFAGNTNLFIYPGYQFKIIDGLITNFHLPKSTLLILVCAFAGYMHTMNAYKEAIGKDYRFFSYGDAMLIL